MELPRPLIPWSDYLDIFPRDLALALGPLVQRLDLVIGTLSTSSRTSTGEPDGFDGITQRGTYDRLLLSEWLLAEEVPEEFSRRAAMSEHAFLQRAHREPAGTKTSVVLFDGGPNQWGAPRIAQMAALIVLARRSQSSGAQFMWGTLQTPTGPLFTDVTTDSISELLEARSPRDPTDADLVSWRERLLAETKDDFWIVGGKPIAGFANLREASFLRIDDVLEPMVRHLSIAIPFGNRRREPIPLELPDDALCARLLRDPFPKVSTPNAATKPATISVHGTPASNLLFAVGGSKILARSQRKGVLSYSIPNSPNAPSGKPKRFQSVYDNAIVAAGRVGKSTVVISVMDAKPAFRLEALGANNPLVIKGEYFWEEDGTNPSPSSVDVPLCPCFAFPVHSFQGSYDAKIVLLTPNGTLFRLALEKGERKARKIASGIEAITPLRENRLGYVLQRLGKRYIVSLDEHDKESTVAVVHPGAGVFFGYGGVLSDNQFGFLAVEGENQQWHINPSFGTLIANGHQTLVAPRGMTVVGTTVAVFTNTGEQPVLVLLSEDRRKITLLGRNGNQVLPRTEFPILHVTVSPFAPLIAYVTERGDVFVYSIPLEKFMYRLITETTK